ncbi:type II secretion system ATPase GspE [Thiofaba sp. EF100]|uniref:type II secretion system ATPase GspE n=1 Tax=Thiofaba sp. EF100 TaxID=3121274 RepID=UPI003221A738
MVGTALTAKVRGDAVRALEERLLAQGKLSRADLERARMLAEEGEGGLVPALLRLGLVSEQGVAEALAEVLGLPMANPVDYPAAPVMEEQLSPRFLRQYKVVPLAAGAERVEVALANPLDDYVIRAIELFSGKAVSCRIGLPAEIDAALDRLYAGGRTEMDQIVGDIVPASDGEREEDVAHLKDMASEAPVIRLVSLIIQRAVEQGASDIHIEPFENELKVRYRVDGLLHEVEAPPPRLFPAVVSRIKIMARLDIAERRLPQDGRIRMRVQGRELDLRVSTFPTMHGESVVMRLLYKDGAVGDFAELGFSERTLADFMACLKQPYGILLVTGPTGSGKTTTLYAALRVLNDPTRKILTVEDPVEYQIPGVNQMQVKPQIGLTFARALRSMVRQDPDVIMIGEMRDLETAEIGVQSALTGHLVLSTLHTNDAPSSITRLLDMGVAGYLVTSVVNGVLAQRLVRRLCPACREAYRPLPELVRRTRLDKVAGREDVTLYRPVGCEACMGTGYHGRIAIMEMLVMTDPLRRLVLEEADARRLAQAAIEGGMTSLYEDGLAKALAGVTSIEEVLRVSQDQGD